MAKKCYPNTKKSRSQITSGPGTYNLKDRNGKTVYTGMSKNVKQRVKQHHYDKSKHFASVCVTPTKTRKEANQLENRRLKQHKPPENKMSK